MELKYRKPKTPALRHLVQICYKELTKKPLLKKQLTGLKNSGGRNNLGRITVYHKGGGHKKKYRNINFKRIKESTGIISSIEYDPNRAANISSVYDIAANKFFYILSPKDVEIGDIVKSGFDIKPKLGYSLPLSRIPVGSLIHNVSTSKFKPAQFSRSAGTFALLKERTLTKALVELSSGEQKLVSSKCYATIGIVSNGLFFLTKLGKAGRSRWLNNRPTVRGVAMNPVDHPHGGGEGKKSGKGFTPWGKPAKKSKNKSSNK